ncbi:MAG: hypothetical protein ACSHYA_03180 [Opitutaceae bacterium]
MRLPALTSGDQRRVNGYLRRAANCRSFAEFDVLFLERFRHILANDLNVLNRQSHDFWTIYSTVVPDHYIPRVLEIIDPANAYLEKHPMIGLITYEPLWEQPHRLSDYVTQSDLRANVLHQEVYQHLGTNYQISMNLAHLNECNLVLTVNRELADFTERELNILHYCVLGLRPIVKALERRIALEKRFLRLTDVIGARAEVCGLDQLTTGEVRAINALMQAPKAKAASEQLAIREDTLKKSLGSIREKLLLESTAQLRAAFRELTPDPTGEP